MTAPAYSLFEFLLTPVETDTTILSGGSVYFYSPGTTETTGIKVYLDKDGSSEANNPYTLDADGTAQLYGSGSYRIVIKDVNGVTQYDRDNYYLSAGPDYVSSVSIGDYASLSAAVTAIGSTSTRLLINKAITVTGDLTVPVNIVLERIQPGTITVSPGATLTIVAAPISDASEWFLGTGTVSVTGYPQEQAWWGNTQRIDSSGYYIKSANVLASAYMMHNVSFTAAVGSKALTVSLKGIDGNAPSSSNPVTIAFRSSTATSSIPVLRTVTSATSVVLSRGSRLGFGAGATGYIFVYAIDYSGTVELALAGSHIGFNNSLVSTTAEGGSGGADSATTLYSTSARSNVACRFIGVLTIQTGGTAGEWDNAPTVLSLSLDHKDYPVTSWSMPYNAASGVKDLALGTQYYPLVSGGTAAAPSFAQLTATGMADGIITGAKLESVSAGTTLTLGSAPTLRQTSSATYVIKKKLTPIKRAGTVTVSFSLVISTGAGGARIYVNDVAVGTERTTGGVYSENITVAYDDVISIYAKNNGAGTTQVSALTVTCLDPVTATEESGY